MKEILENLNDLRSEIKDKLIGSEKKKHELRKQLSDLTQLEELLENVEEHIEDIELHLKTWHEKN
jgi:hypothetical protein